MGNKNWLVRSIERCMVLSYSNSIIFTVPQMGKDKNIYFCLLELFGFGLAIDGKTTNRSKANWRGCLGSHYQLISRRVRSNCLCKSCSKSSQCSLLIFLCSKYFLQTRISWKMSINLRSNADLFQMRKDKNSTSSLGGWTATFHCSIQRYVMFLSLALGYLATFDDWSTHSLNNVYSRHLQYQGSCQDSWLGAGQSVRWLPHVLVCS